MSHSISFIVSIQKNKVYLCWFYVENFNVNSRLNIVLISTSFRIPNANASTFILFFYIFFCYLFVQFNAEIKQQIKINFYKTQKCDIYLITSF